jgi:hypothetical protein
MGIFTLFKRTNKRAETIQKIFSNSSDIITGKDSTSFAAIDLICSSFANLLIFTKVLTHDIIKE